MLLVWVGAYGIRRESYWIFLGSWLWWELNNLAHEESLGGKYVQQKEKGWEFITLFRLG